MVLCSLKRNSFSALLKPSWLPKSGRGIAAAAVVVNRAPQAAQEAIRAFHAVVAPFQRLLGRRGKHHKQARGVGTVSCQLALAGRHRCFSISTFFGAANHHRQAVGFEHGGNRAAFVVERQIHIRGLIQSFAAVGRFAVVGVAHHHALGEQARQTARLHSPSLHRASVW